MVRSRTLSLTALLACLVALSVIGLGAFTRLIDAGLGCPDWPGCYGHLIAPLQGGISNSHYVTYKAWSEMIHRYFAGTLSILVLIVVIMSFLKELRTKVDIFSALALIVLVVYQIILGQQTVTLKLLPIIVTQHLLGGFLILTTLWFIYLNNSILLKEKLSRQRISCVYFAGAILALAILFGQIFLGAWTSTNYASLSCTDFPFCVNGEMFTWHFQQAFNLLSPVGVNYDGGVLPEAARQTIQMTHRIGAAVFTGYILLFSLFLMPKIKNNFEILKSLYVIFGLLSIQLCLGISNVVFKLPTFTAVCHTLVAVLLLLSVISLTFKIGYTACQRNAT